MLVLPQTFPKVHEKLSILKRCVFLFFPVQNKFVIFFSIGVFFATVQSHSRSPTGAFLKKLANFARSK